MWAEWHEAFGGGADLVAEQSGQEAKEQQGGQQQLPEPADWQEPLRMGDAGLYPFEQPQQDPQPAAAAAHDEHHAEERAALEAQLREARAQVRE